MGHEEGSSLVFRGNRGAARHRILTAVVFPRLLALAPVAGFAVLSATLTAAGELPVAEALWAVVAVAVAFGPSGWVQPAGWPRRLAEGALLPVAYALTMLGDPSLRRMAIPPLLLLAAWGAAAAALARAPLGLAPLLAGSLGGAVRAAGGLGLMGYPWPLVVGTLVVCVAVPAALARRWGPQTGVAAALLVPWLPYAGQPGLLAAAAAAALAALLAPKVGEPLEPLAARWVPSVAAAALVVAPLAPWEGLPVARLFPAAGWLAGIAALLALLVAGRHPPALGGVAWLGVACLLGPPQPAPPDRAGVTLTPAAPVAALPPGNGERYVVDLALANASGVASGTAVAELAVGFRTYPLRAGEDTAEWAHQRGDVRGAVLHTLPRWPVWRPHGEGRGALWGVGGRLEVPVPSGVVPELRRAGDLAPEITVAVSTAGPSRPTPPRALILADWLAGCALVVAAVQLLGGTWRRPVAALPWVLLASGAALARAPVEPLGLLLERHGVDLCLAALLAAWVPAARGWLARRRVFAAAAVLLVPLAVAAAFLHPPGGDEQYHLIVLRSLAEDHDLDLANNYELERYPENRIYVTPVWLHSPLLALLLSPGYALAGRAGALALLGLAGAALLALVASLARRLRCPPNRVALMALLALLSFPLATFSSQIWTEIPGALAAAAVATLLSGVAPAFLPAAGLAILATGLKTRLALMAFPTLAAPLSGLIRQRRRLRGALLLLGLATAAALALATAIYGHPLGPIRRFHHLLPRSLRQPAISFVGLIFDRAGGMLFAAPLLLVGASRMATVWRRAAAPVRGLLLGGLATLLLLLPSHEWYGGGSPPLRYLVPALPVFLLGLAVLWTSPSRARTAAILALPPTMLVWFVFATRPHLAFNPGDGGWWLGDALARRFAADTRALFPSLLVPTAAALWVPLVVVLLTAAGWLLLRRRASAGRTLGRLAVPIWLLAAAGLVATLAWRNDRVVELEAAQVVRRGGAPEPPEGTFSRFLHRNGWRLRAGEGVSVPLRVPPRAGVELEALGAGLVEASWEGGDRWTVQVLTPSFARFPLPPPPGPGRQQLHLQAVGPGEGEVVLDRVEVMRP